MPVSVLFFSLHILRLLLPFVFFAVQNRRDGNCASHSLHIAITKFHDRICFSLLFIIFSTNNLYLDTWLIFCWFSARPGASATRPASGVTHWSHSTSSRILFYRRIGTWVARVCARRAVHHLGAKIDLWCWAMILTFFHFIRIPMGNVTSFTIRLGQNAHEKGTIEFQFWNGIHLMVRLFYFQF